MASAPLNISPDQLAQLWNKKGLIYRKAGKLVESVECYDKALEIDGSNAAAWSNKARALDEMNMLPEAMKCYKKALQINPNSASTWNNQGYAYRKLKRYKEALECYDRAIQLWPQYDKAWFNKGYICEQQERYRDALECFNYAIEFNPENEKYKRSREIVYQAIKQQQQELQKPESPPPPAAVGTSSTSSRPDKRDKLYQSASATTNAASSEAMKAQRAAATRSPAPDRPVSRTAHTGASRPSHPYQYQPISPDPEEETEIDNLAGSDAIDVGAPSGHFSDGEVRHVSQRTSPTTGQHHGSMTSPHGTLRDAAVRELLMNPHDAGAASNRYSDAGVSSNYSSFGNPFGFESADEAPEPGSMPPPRQTTQRSAVKPSRSMDSSLDSLQGSDEMPVPPPKSAQTPTKQRTAVLTSSEEARLQQQLAFLALQDQQQAMLQQQSQTSHAQAHPLSQSRRAEQRPAQQAPSSGSGSRSDPAIEIRSGQQTPNSSGEPGPRDISSPRLLGDETDAHDAFDQLIDQLNSIESIEGVYVFESRVEELLGAVRQRKQELQSRMASRDDVKCSICLDGPPQMICIPCGHLCLCENCSKKLMKKKCPICNLRVKNIYKVFKA
jgi:tetratricopeptide (TPR) repeat protein